MSEFRKAIQTAINYHSQENNSNTPDFILAEYLHDCLKAFDKACNRRGKWHGNSDSVDIVRDSGPSPVTPEEMENTK